MKAGIIAAGEGSRLKSEGITIPKPLVTVDGTPLIERLMRTYIRNGISEVVCIVNEYSVEVKAFVEQKRFPIPIHFVVKTTPSSMHSLFALSPYLMEGPFLLSTVDSIFNEEEFAGYIRHARRQAPVDGILAVTNYVDDESPLYVKMDTAHRIQSFSKSEQSLWVTGGIYVFSPRIFREIESVLNKNVERLRNFLSYLVDHGYKLEGYPFSKIVDIDHIHDIHTAEEMLRHQ